ncbi:MAG: hypothetical protein HKN72_10590 [Gemmatimonadetes bacterium]|nr:hypothetical protein [Gemmatimonadota bacterium]
MTVVFRIRTSAGQELSFASREMFEDFVRSGELSPDDLVYDGETGSWAPARTHPVVLDVQYEAEAAGDADPSSQDAEGDGDEAPPTIGGPGLEFDLALTEELSPEDEQRVFLEQLEAERKAQLDAEPSLRESLTGFTSDTLAPRDPPRRVPDSQPQRASSSPRSRPGGRSATPRERAAAATAASAPAKRSGGLGRGLLLLVIAGLVVAAGYAGYQSWAAESEPDPSAAEVPEATTPEADPVEPEPEPFEPEPEPEPEPESEPALEAVIPDTPAALRERTQERYLAATRAELRSLQPIPEIWPEGPYITVPSDHPEVVDVWQDYRATIQSVRQVDADRYRAAIESALDDAAVTGEGRQTRLETAMGEFEASDELRAAHFDRVEALATAAIQSHNALVEAEGLILFDATGSTGRPSGIGAGTSGRNAEAQLLLDQVTELLEGALDADGEGPGSGANVREWVWDGFLDAMTR